MYRYFNNQTHLFMRKVFKFLAERRYTEFIFKVFDLILVKICSTVPLSL